MDGIAGARNIYRRRGEAEEAGGDQLLPKRIKFVMDCSGTLAISHFFLWGGGMQRTFFFKVHEYIGFNGK